MGMPEQAPVPQPSLVELYATLSGLVDASMVSRVFHNGALAVNGGVKTLHLLIQSTGGTVGDGIALYNYLRGLPIEIRTYNGGSVASIAVLLYLAGKVRKVSKTATFMIHRSTFQYIVPTAAESAKVVAESLVIDDRRSETILKEHLQLPQEKWEIHSRVDLNITAEEGVTFGVAHEIGDFTVPDGGRLFNI